MSFSFDQIRETLLSDGLVMIKRSDHKYLLLSVSPLFRENSLESWIIIPSAKSIDNFAELDLELRERIEGIWRTNSTTGIVLSPKSNTAAASKNSNTAIFYLPHGELFHKLSRNFSEPIYAIVTESLSSELQIDVILDGYSDQLESYNQARLIKFAKNEELDNRDKFDGAWRVVELRGDDRIHPEDFVISRKRKLYKFAKFAEDHRCFDLKSWREFYSGNFAKLSSHREIVVEIGAGSAIFLTRLAQRNPGKIFVAIDRKSDRLWQGAKLAREMQLENIFYLWSDVAKLTQAFAEHSVDEIWLTFSDPYASALYQDDRAELAKFYHDFLRFPEVENYSEKLEEYRKRIKLFDSATRRDFAKYLSKNSRARLTDRRFLEIFAKLLVKGGNLNFKTDNAPLFEWSLDSFHENGWRVELLSRNVGNEAGADFEEAKVMTSYEERFSRELLPISFAKIEAPF